MSLAADRLQPPPSVPWVGGAPGNSGVEDEARRRLGRERGRPRSTVTPPRRAPERVNAGGKRARSRLDSPTELDCSLEMEDPRRGERPSCSYCALTFSDRAALRAHCSTSQHHTVIMSDEGRDWKWRPPPRGYTSDAYVKCDSWDINGNCRYGAQCVEAHGAEELAEWKERFDYRKMKMQRACEKELYGKSYTEQLLEKWSQATSPEKVMKEKIDGIEDACSADLITTISSKVSKREWMFVLKSKRPLRAVALLQDAHRNHFALKQILPGEAKTNKKGRDSYKMVEADLHSDQEWTSSSADKSIDSERSPLLEHRVKVAFSTDIYGTFRQSVVFDFGYDPALVKHLCVDVVPVTDADKIKEIRKEMVLSSSKRWDTDNSDIVAFSSPVYPDLATPYGKETCDRDQELLNAYPSPRESTLCLTQATVAERILTKNNYRTRMHELLSVEELARCEQVARYNLACKLRVAPSYLLAPSGMATSTAKYAHSGELFALLTLGKDVSEDTSAGRLILNNCSTVLISSSTPPMAGMRRRVYEALIEDKGKNMIYLRLSAVAVHELGMRADTDFAADIQFQLNRLTYCEWHYAVDRITDYRLIFPDVTVEPEFSWLTHPMDTLDFRLNEKQKDAVLAITSSVGMPIPPILIIGPFGTGKTYTLAQAIKQLLLQSDSKILICTHSNSAADLYIKDYIHPWLEAGITDAKPLRIYYHKRWVATVDDIVQQYCLIEMNGGVRSFQLPTLEDVLKHRIVVVTLSISMYLSTLGLPKGYFTHILLDEAAQAMESEALMPLALATSTTRIVLAGDHMQLSPEIFSQFAKERNLHISLLERLYEHYPVDFRCKILLRENYRAHEAIIGFTSELFYEQKLIASGKQPRHEKFYPLTFFTTRGEDVQDQNSTAFYNNSEVYEVVERVNELRCNWPAAWGKLDEQSIGIMTPYADQVFRIRSELRKRRMGGISVERVLNVQGKQFRAVFLSTVRTRRTCQASSESDYGFLSNRKLLNTAITRAQSLVAVVGDPVALCSIGRCRKVWERFISTCNENKSLYGITWSLLRSQLDGVELKKTYTLNPLAPEFVPRALQPEAYIKLQLNEVTGPPLVQAPINISLPMPQVNPAVIRQSNSGQMPPILNSANPPLIPYPFIYFPGGNNQQQPHNTNVFPISRAPIPQPPPVPMSNIPPPSHQVNSNIPWNANTYSLSSPSDPGTPTWSLKQQQKKTIELNTQPQLRNIQRIVPSRFAGSPHLFTPQLLQSKPQTFLPVPPQQKSPENSPIVNENFVPNDILGPTFLRSGPMNMPPERFSYPANINKYPENIPLNMAKEKEQIQFLQNVHFPEKTMLGHGGRENQPVLQLNTNHQDINENPELQLRWYQQHLMDSQNTERTSKLMDIVQRRLVTTQPMKHLGSQIDSYTFPNDFPRNVDNLMFTEKNIHSNQQVTGYSIPNGHGLLTHTESERTWPLNDFKQENVASQYINNKSLVRDFESSMVISNNMYNQNSNQREEKMFNTRSYVPNDTLEVPWQTSTHTQSVPLYRRQAAPPKNIMNQNDPSLSQGLLENLDKQNSSTGAFAGYARAFSLQQVEPPMMNQHNAMTMSERPMLNGGLGLTDYRILSTTLPPQRFPPPQSSEYTRTLNGTLDNIENDNTTYASVLRQNTPKLEEDKNELSVLRDYGNKPQHGLYHYFN